MSKAITFADFGDIKINVKYVIGIMFDDSDEKLKDNGRGNCYVYVDTDDSDLKRIDLNDITRGQFKDLCDRFSGKKRRGLGKILSIRKKLPKEK